MPQIVMVLHGHALTGPSRNDGQYLKDFDFEAHNGRGEIELTKNIREAKLFPDMTAAFEFYRHSPKCKPWREDGKPNRPLTASNWEFRTVTLKNGEVEHG